MKLLNEMFETQDRHMFLVLIIFLYERLNRLHSKIYILSVAKYSKVHFSYRHFGIKVHHQCRISNDIVLETIFSVSLRACVCFVYERLPTGLVFHKHVFD